MAASLGQDETLTINGKTVALTNNMTQDQVIAKINERSSQTGVTASLTDNGGIKYLTLTSNQYGSGRTIVASSSIASGTDTTGVGVPQSRVTAGVAQSENLNKAEKLTINGIDIDLKVGLNQDQVVAKINEFTAQTGVIATRTDKDGKNTGNFLTLSRSAAGPTQAISVVSTISNGGGTPAKNTSGIGTVAVTESSSSGENGAGTGVAGSGLGASTEGVDVAGTINGEEATGKGQILTGKSGNQTTDGLVVRIAAPTPGAYGTVRFSKGISSILTDYLDTITRPTTGSVKSAQDAIQSELSNIDKDIASMNTQLTTKQERLRIQFATM
jgi:flagellar hook-associated protein 2